MGAVFSGTLGSSEKNIREAMQISEVIAPCILWIDEIEKALSVSTGDSGTSSRVLGTFLTWLQEKQKPVVVFATANDVRRLPVAFLRKQRFDEVFFLDLPTREERAEIFEVHLRKKGYSMIAERFDLEKLADVSLGYVGAEIEAVVKDAMFPAFMDNERELKTEDLLLSIADMVPMAKSHSEEIDELRKWVKNGKARNASFIENRDEVKMDNIRRTRSARMMDV
jgi:SpoVK/Ycf46/Vps4 family AAA+-type ATPase